MTAHLAVEHLTKRFGRATALDRLSFDLGEGEFVCLVGPSGCGKTTALRIVAGLETPSEGRILCQGRDITAVPLSQRGMGMVFQSYALFPNMTAAQNIEFALNDATSAKGARARVGELLELVDLAGFAARLPAQLSGGQQQRVAIARALAREPGILLLDEPLSALDPQIRGRLRNELKSLQRRLGITTLMVTHDQAEALAVAARIAVMRAGRLLQVGSPREIYEAPADPFTAEFVGALNLLPALAETPDTVRILDRIGLSRPHGFASGTKLLAAIRPEFIEVAPAGSGAIHARIETREFQGAFIRLSLAIDGYDRRLLADVSAAQDVAEEGQIVGINMPDAYIRLFPADPAP